VLGCTHLEDQGKGISESCWWASEAAKSGEKGEYVTR
jgi:hypothetical protein